MMNYERRYINIQGCVQGVGFRPFIYRLARKMCLSGSVYNTGSGVTIDVQGDTRSITEFLQDLQSLKPVQAEIRRLHWRSVSPSYDLKDFVICGSDSAKDHGLPDIPTDLAPCEACLKEMFEPENRRYAYPFTHCTDCGPRFSIIKALPFDRENTTMSAFTLCRECKREYHDPCNRRFHAEAIACPECGPELKLVDCRAETVAGAASAIEQAVRAIDDGKIVAVKSVGGYQLLADATNAVVVRSLRRRKQRPEKPFALLFPDIQSVQQHCELTDIETNLLLSPQRPIVLLAKKDYTPASPLVDELAPGVPFWGAMLPSTPLHVLLMARVSRPLVATSANRPGEPICISDDDAFAELAGIADLFLTHDRLIESRVDDSVVRVINNQPCVMRLGRGYAPASFALPVTENEVGPEAVLLAVGGHMKCSMALADKERVCLSPHIADLDSRASVLALESLAEKLCAIYAVSPDAMVHDLHPGYASSQWARTRGLELIPVQHHIAHFFSCMAEHAYRGPALGICWDGTGYSDDNIIRGGECFYWNGTGSIARAASLLAFPLPGGEQAIREPRRLAAALLYTLLGREAFSVCPTVWQQFNRQEYHNIRVMLERGLNCPSCSSIGRLFDGVSALLGFAPLRQYEGQAAMALEKHAMASAASWHLPFAIRPDESNPTCQVIDWRPMLHKLLALLQTATSVNDIAAAFHNSLARMVVVIAESASSIDQAAGSCPVFLSGGVFQNKRLAETLTAYLRPAREVFYHHRVPPNDGGLALGQIYFATQMGSRN